MAEPGILRAEELRMHRDHRMPAIQLGKYDFPPVQLSILFKGSDSGLKMINDGGGKTGENE